MHHPGQEYIPRSTESHSRQFWTPSGQPSLPTARGPEWSAKCSGLWHANTVQNILRNPVYMGDLAWNRRTLARFHRITPTGPTERLDALLRRTTLNPQADWIIVRDCHEEIVDRELWKAAKH